MVTAVRGDGARPGGDDMSPGWSRPVLDLLNLSHIDAGGHSYMRTTQPGHVRHRLQALPLGRESRDGLKYKSCNHDGVS